MLTIPEIDEFLYSHGMGHLGCYGNGKTYVVPVGYVYDGEYIYGHTEEGMKVSIMRQNPEVCFQLEQLDDMVNWKSVIAWGHFEEVTETSERHAILDTLLERKVPAVFSRLMQSFPQWPFTPVNKNEIGGIVYRIRLTEKTGRFERSGAAPFLG